MIDICSQDDGNNRPNNFSFQLGTSPRRRGSTTTTTTTTDPQPPNPDDDWSNSFPRRPKSSINRTSTSGTMSDRSPGGYSTPRLLSAAHRTYQEVSPMDSTSTSSTALMGGSSVGGGFSRDMADDRDRQASALRRSREPSPVTVVTDFITTGPYR